MSKWFQSTFRHKRVWLTNGLPGKSVIQNRWGFHRTGKKQLSQLKHAVYDGRSFATGDRVTGLSPQGGRLMRTLFLTLLHQEISNERTRRQTSP
ncbi:hypothetical protein EMIT0P43_110029 [Pseudomonas jessenii]